MSETHLVLICALSAIGLMGSAWFAIFLLVQGKNRIIAEHGKALEAEQRATASRQTFMDNAHHELKTSLQVIDGYLGMLRTTSSSEPQEEMVARATASTQSGEIVLRVTSHLEGSAIALTLEVDNTGEGLPMGAESALTQPCLDGQKPLTHPGSLSLGLPLTTGLSKAFGRELTLARLPPGTPARVRLTQPQPGPSRGRAGRVSGPMTSTAIPLR